MERVKSRFPDGISYAIPYDTTAYVNVAIDNVVQNLFVAILLVIIIIYIFSTVLASYGHSGCGYSSFTYWCVCSDVCRSGFLHQLLDTLWTDTGHWYCGG